MAVITCHGNSEDHCCYLNGQVCDHLEEGTVPGRRWACGLLVKYGTWEAANQSPKYRPVGDHWVTMGEPFNLCELHSPAFCCRPEYRLGRSNARAEPRLDLIGATSGDVG